MAPALKEEEYTIEDIYELPAGKRAELIDGQMYMMAPPTRTHQRYVGRLYNIISDYIDNKNGACEVNIAPCGVFLNADDTTYVEPDIFVVCDPQKLDEKGCHGAPDWIIEIVSPGSRNMDGFTKLFRYQSAGVREYWMADYNKRAVTVWNFEKQTVEEYAFDQPVPAGIYEDLEIDFSKLKI